MNHRIASVDALRGLALFGILVVNILAFSSPYYASGMLPPEGRTPADAALAFSVSALFEFKFYLLFSLLFGYSVTLQMRSAEEAGVSLFQRMLRRQLGLFIIGVLHALVLFHGDILTTYAVLGLVLIAIRGWSDAAKLKLAFGLVAATAVVWAGLAGLQWSEPARNETALMQQHVTAATQAYRGAAMSVIRQHAVDPASFFPLLLLLQAPCALAMFLVGFVAGRHRVLERPDLYRPYIKRAVLFGLMVGLPPALGYAAASQYVPGAAAETASLALTVLTAPFLAVAIAATCVGLLESRGVEPLRATLASAGRMALSNYLTQSLVCALIFHGYGMAMVGRLSMAATMLIAVTIFLGQVAISMWWLRSFAYGPVEWLLRAVTVWRWPPWRSARA